MGTLFQTLGDKIIQAILSHGIVDPVQYTSLLKVFDEDPELQKIFSREIEAAALQGGKNITGQLNKQGVNLSFHNFSNNTKTILQTKAFEASNYTLSKVKGDVMASLTTSYQDGIGINESARNLRNVFTNLDDDGLNNIARTEINGAQNQGAHLTLQELGVEYQKWWTAKDSRVRGRNSKDKADHVKMHGQIVKVGDKFSNGLEYPGDRSGRIEEWINCRCTLVPFIMPRGKMVPIGKSYFYEDDLVDKPVET